MSKLGIHFPNAGFRDLDALWSIPWNHFTVLHLNREWVPEIRLRYPQATILIRAYLENWAAIEPVGWARSIAQWANDLRPFNIELTFANEQNLAVEGHPQGARAGADYPPPSLYRDILEWDISVIRELRSLLPWATIHFPALSQGHSDDEPDAGYVGFEILREAVEMCDVLDAHVYWDENATFQRENNRYGARYTLLHSLFPNLPIYISECGTLTSSSRARDDEITDWVQALPDYVAGACWFIWDSDSANLPWILLNRPLRVQALRTFGLSQASSPPVESPFSPTAIAQKLIMSTTAFHSTRYLPVAASEQRIGFGHIVKAGEQVGDSMSLQDAQRLLQEDLSRCLQGLGQSVKSPLTLDQKVALLSLIYNLGPGGLSPALIDALNSSDVFAAADIIGRASSTKAGDAPESLRMREMESTLFVKDSLPLDPQALLRIPGREVQAAPACCISVGANWISVTQGERFQAVGVWYYTDSIQGFAPSEAAVEESAPRGKVLVKVENESGVGIPAELIVRRRNSQSGECEPQFSDAFGTAEFELGVGSQFDPQQGAGPDRIHVGDCIIAGLGVPTRQGVGSTQALGFIRIRKIA